MMHSKSVFGSKWILVYFLNASELMFFDDDNILFSNLTSRYSVLGSLDDSYKNNGYFYFLLEYPELGDKKYIYWKQIMNPVHTELNDNIGYVPIKVPEFTRNEKEDFKGLAKSADSSDTFFDGSPGDKYSSFYYSIGSKKSYRTDGKIPGPHYIVNNVETIVSLVYLWVRAGSICSVNMKHFNHISVEFICVLLLVR